MNLAQKTLDLNEQAFDTIDLAVNTINMLKESVSIINSNPLLQLKYVHKLEQYRKDIKDLQKSIIGSLSCVQCLN